MIKNQQGQILIQIIVFGSVAVLIFGGLVGWASVNIGISKREFNRELAIQIAEAGIDYYRWHLAHAPQDFQDGTGVPGPYTHIYYDKNDDPIGRFILTITPPPVGSTLVGIRSEGRVDTDAIVKRTIAVQMSIPSWAKFSVAANADIRFGEGTEVYGLLHSNGGIRFDGLAHNIVSSARADYNDPDHIGNNEFSVHTHRNAPPGNGVNDNFRPLEAPPTAPVPDRSDIFESSRQFPVPAIDFTGMTTDLAQIKTDAEADGRYFASSGTLGYHIILKNDTFDLYRVTSLIAPPWGCNNSQSQTGWGSWSIQAELLILQNQIFPNNGLIFVEDNTWVDGQINSARLTIASARFPDNPATRTSITINKDILYTNYDGQDVVALMAQQNINAGLKSNNILRIDAALVAQNGRIGRYYYRSACDPDRIKNIITLYGTLITNQRYGFAYTDGSGYQTRNIIYDANLLYTPPPSFPLTSDQYTTLSWKEVK
ncbi:MAG: hypothetical protein Q8O66_00595 [bacterium]|nr:hypothetical protein [bacterium]